MVSRESRSQEPEFNPGARFDPLDPANQLIKKYPGINSAILPKPAGVLPEGHYANIVDKVDGLESPFKDLSGKEFAKESPFKDLSGKEFAKESPYKPMPPVVPS